MFQDLPELILDLVCDHLSYEDVLALRSTCKDLKVFVDRKQFTKLHLLHKKFWFHHRLFYTDEPVSYPHSFHSDDLAILNSERFQKRFANLRKMSICHQMLWPGQDETEFDLNYLNRFQKLSHLEISDFPCIKGRLSLQELEVAAFQTYLRPSKQSSFELNCPRLRALKIRFFRPFLTEDTDQLENLYYHDKYYDSNSDPMNLLKRNYLKSISSNLRNLSTICFQGIDELLRFFSDLETGLSVPSLIGIRLERCCCFRQFDELIVPLEDLKKDPHTNHIEFTLNGKQFRSPDELREISSLIQAYDASVEDVLNFYANISLEGYVNFNLHSLGAPLFRFLKETPKLEFLFSAVDGLQLSADIELNEEMIKKLKNIHLLSLNSQRSESTIELFVRTWKSVDFLIVSKQTLTERLLEMLSNHLRNLERVHISNCKYETLKPLAKFGNLGQVELDFYPSSDELNFIYENNRSLEIVSINSYESYLLRSTTSPKIYGIDINRGGTEHKFETLHSMIDYYEDRVKNIKNPIRALE